MERKRIVGIFRAERFSPNSVENDRLIMRKVLERLKEKGCEVRGVTEEQLVSDGEAPKADLILTMARSKAALDILRESETLNKVSGVEICGDRSKLDALMRENDIPCPPRNGDDGIWLKRGDETAQVPEDTVFCRDEEEVTKAMARFTERGITNVVRQAHVAGDLVKFYGVGGTDFFYFFYPTDSGRSKFGQEIHNGEAHHYDFDAKALKIDVDRIAALTGVVMYGGDAIVRADGTYAIIDYNDWPTFSPCRDEAAAALTGLVV